MKRLGGLQALTDLFVSYKLFNLYHDICDYKLCVPGSQSCGLTSPSICILRREKLDEYVLK